MMRRNKLLGVLILVLLCLGSGRGLASIQKPSTAPMTIAMADMSLPDAIRLLAGYLHVNVMISRSVHGAATFNLHESSSVAALDMLLAAHGLSRALIGDVWLVGTQEELLKRKQQLIKMHQLEEEAEPIVMQVWQLHYASSADVVQLIGGKQALLSKRGHAQADERTNQLYVEETASRLHQIAQLIKCVDIPARQVAVDARIVSLDTDAQRELGFNFVIAANSSGGGHGASKNDGTVSIKKQGQYSLAIARLADGSLLDVKLAALENAGHAELISSPSLYASNQQTASIEAGEEVPYQEVSESGGTAIAFKKAVLGLKVTPQILPGNNVLMKLQINQDRPDGKLVLSMPTISTRQIVTSILAKSGQTIVLGGIYENSASVGEERMPYLSSVPIVGWFFKLQKNRISRRELLIFVTPTIVDHAL